MSHKNNDRQGRWRNINVSFRVSPGEDEMLERKVSLSGSCAVLPNYTDLI